jgi:hypothetical protein
LHVISSLKKFCHPLSGKSHFSLSGDEGSNLRHPELTISAFYAVASLLILTTARWPSGRGGGAGWPTSFTMALN